MSLIGEHGDKQVRMAHLATVASHTSTASPRCTRGCSRETVLRDFAELWPERFTNVTNGVTPRRFVALANPRAGPALIDRAIGDGWIAHLERLRDARDASPTTPAFRDEWRAVKRRRTRPSSRSWLRERTGVAVDPAALFDAQCKRIHEYKRQHLNLLHVVALWERLRRVTRRFDCVPRTFVFAGKAAPGVPHGEADHPARARRRRGGRTPTRAGAAGCAWCSSPTSTSRTRSAIYPAADLSEQISTAGMEASGTGNMKFTLNGALTIGTLDGANVEIREAVGAGPVLPVRADRRRGDHAARQRLPAARPVRARRGARAGPSS